MAVDHRIQVGPTVRGSGVNYPESDGKLMGESGAHIDALVHVIGMLRRFFAGQQRVAVLANMFLYFQEGDPKRAVCPDLFVIRDFPRNTKRRTFKVWQEGKGPDFVLEITFKQTRKEDPEKQLAIYRDVLKVRKYFLFDSLEEYLDPSLQGFHLLAERDVPLPFEDGGLFSEVLGLRLEREDSDLRFRDPRTGVWIRSEEELLELAGKAERAIQSLES